ncbi:uncharacterized protein K460DRAFT_414995 [Cucurbitaria berberidis CBS 394.84]|uniref:Uncharacterized protein n=1 Tax=Cucurbitaria berberidis CBS 394.84 TaxID=1168544 RepID=A0A9P4GNX2_9PLEO|nr:uncharacterized protein K460DRAFT_414995 [Cucurbitaria berberidis CBS 394.84]KAF1848440.1 hypothetical protein K460DRAFT_414995 [Cucurbitaria berberidis CBS 394.84]
MARSTRSLHPAAECGAEVIVATETKHLAKIPNFEVKKEAEGKTVESEEGWYCGSIYFTAHPVDSLLFQNPDLFHDLFVLKCVTTVVFTSGDRGNTDNFSFALEHGLEEAYSWIAGVPANEPKRKATLVKIGKYEVPSWAPKDMPSMQILYLRLPDGAPAGQGYDTNGGESLKKLYNKEIKSITTTDGNVTYTLEDLKDIIVTVLHERQANDIRVLNYKASVSHEYNTDLDHADHTISAKLVIEVIEEEKIRANVKVYAGHFMRKLEANLGPLHPDYERKANAFFKYAEHDEQMCQNLEECEDELEGDEADLFLDRDVKHISHYLEREYYVS